MTLCCVAAYRVSPSFIRPFRFRRILGPSQRREDRVSTAPSTPVAATTAASPAVVIDVPLLDRDRSGDAVIWGLSAAAWVKVLIVSALLVALFRFNLARLWAKTNPFTGESNWQHSWWIPLVGLYYLYLNRVQLLAA
jgi:hypothetical protein